MVPNDQLARNFIYGNIEGERLRQDQKWGDQSGNEDILWSVVLSEEAGEVAKETLHLNYEGTGTIEHLREELIQVAAVAVAWVEALDKR